MFRVARQDAINDTNSVLRTPTVSFYHVPRLWPRLILGALPSPIIHLHYDNLMMPFMLLGALRLAACNTVVSLPPSRARIMAEKRTEKTFQAQ